MPSTTITAITDLFIFWEELAEFRPDVSKAQIMRRSRTPRQTGQTCGRWQAHAPDSDCAAAIRFQAARIGSRPTVRPCPVGEDNLRRFHDWPTMTARVRFLFVLAAATLLATLSATTSAQSSAAYPNRPVKLVVPFPPGGPLDIIGRAIAQKASEDWGQSVVVDNRPGAGGNIGADIVAKSAPDGYTIVMGALSTHAVNPSLYGKMPYDAIKDFAPISLVAITPNVLVVNASLPVNSAKEFIAYAKANSGKLAFGSGSNGSAGHLAGELFKVDTGTDIVHVPYKGGAPATQALLAGDTQFMFDNLANAMPQVKAGKLKALAVTTAERSKLAPELPTMAEAGLPGFDISTWFGLLAPAGTPKDVIAKWNAEVTKILNSPDMRDRLTAQGATPAPTTPEQFAAFIQSEIPKYARIVKVSGAKVD
jgi:tripartite-type tricarboxylate transporter receptor subunit TctC